MDSYSGIVIEDCGRSEHFSDFTEIPCKGHNILCKAKRYGRWWMLKGLKASCRHDVNYRNLLQKEFDILISLQHPNIVSASSFEEVPGLGTCIVMEWVDGLTLEEWIANHHSITDGNGTKRGMTESLHAHATADIMLQLLDALQYVHAKQVVHRDLKPSNIMLTHNGCRVKLIDFGLADTDSYAILKQPAGTPCYMSPEQKTSRHADIRNDIYSLGCIMEAMGMGKRYTSVIKRCKAEADRRYADVVALREAFLDLSKEHHHRTFMAIGSVVVLAVAMTVGAHLYNIGVAGPNKPNETPDHATLTVERNDSTQVEDSSHHISHVSSPQQKEMATTPLSHTSSSVIERRLIAEGKASIDRMWQRAGIDTIRSESEKGIAFSRFVEQSNAFITENYPKTFTLEVSGQQGTHIVYALSAYLSEQYVKPMLHRFQQD